jgi:kynurenine 3-monooxygenase
VLGAGPVGCCLAIMLVNKGYLVDIYEKRADPSLGATGAGRSVNLTISPRAMEAFTQVGLLDQLFKNSVPISGRTIYRSNGTTFSH